MRQARAGEAGRGFAVVADEVRKLAENTARATGEIDQVIQAIHVDMNHAVETMGDGVNRVGEGVSVTRALGDSMQELASGADGVVSTVSEITMSLRQQTARTSKWRPMETIARMSGPIPARSSASPAPRKPWHSWRSACRGDQRIPAELSKTHDAASGRVPWRLFFWRQMPGPGSCPVARLPQQQTDPFVRFWPAH